nr:HAMP domain-containing histidine kinase [Bacteroidaceae bacterium]
KVEVSASDSEIRVKDNGSGMSPDILEHAFIPFFTTKPTGTGIGLSLCRQIILKHGGTIRVESQEGCGTTFIIKL